MALFNGVRQVPQRSDLGSDYCLKVNGHLDVDIPEREQSLDNYRASLAHKCNHSFKPNAKFYRIDHARFGLIGSIIGKAQ